MAQSADVQAQRAQLGIALANLRVLIEGLPLSVPEGTEDGALVGAWGSLEDWKGEGEGPYYALDKAWLRSFQGDEKKQLAMICRGPFGMGLVHARISELVAEPEMDDSLTMVLDKVKVLSELVVKR